MNQELKKTFLLRDLTKFFLVLSVLARYPLLILLERYSCIGESEMYEFAQLTKEKANTRNRDSQSLYLLKFAFSDFCQCLKSQ